jgi:hypothetical protein
MTPLRRPKLARGTGASLSGTSDMNAGSRWSFRGACRLACSGCSAPRRQSLWSRVRGPVLRGRATELDPWRAAVPLQAAAAQTLTYRNT